jgi:tRNA pseudouridine55 synthase
MLHAIILLDKPKGATSQDAVTLVKRRLGLTKAGHTGTLDPIATGLLIVCAEEATKIARFLSDLPKEYVATLKLGERTDTFDAEGKVIEQKEVKIEEGHLREILKKFTGKIKQVPPMYSALKYEGKPLYELARKGIVVEREEREVEVHSLELLELAPPYARLRIECEKGTYIRTLADDIGREAGCLAHLAELRRTKIGPFKVENAVSIDELSHVCDLTPGAVLPLDEALSFMQEVVLDPINSKKAKNGAPVKILEPVSGFLRMKDEDGKLFAIGNAFRGIIRVERGLRL